MKQKEDTLLKDLAIYQAKNGALELRKDVDMDTIWASKKQIAQIFDVDRSVISRHIKNIFKDEELNEREVYANFAHTTAHGSMKDRTQTKQIPFYNLDIILAVGYRVNSKVAIEFRKWATKTLKEHIVKGFTINKKRIEANHELFLKTIEDIKLLTKRNRQIDTNQVLELIKSFSHTWFFLQSYDQQVFPKKGTKKEVDITAEALQQDLEKLKKELINKGQATDMFAEEKQKGNLQGIVGNVFQTVFGKPAYPTIEEKASHLLYFIIKNHPFTDGNKRSGAFAFVWFLQKASFQFRKSITPETLTAITILIAESDPKHKEKMIGVILLLLSFGK